MLLETKDLHVTIGSQDTVKILSGIDLQLADKQVIGLIGESGSGKSITVKAILGLLPSQGKVSKGEILYKGVNTLEMKIKEQRNMLGKEFGIIFQNPMTSLNPLHKVKKQISEVIYKHNIDLTETEVIEKVDKLLEEVRIPDIETTKEKYPHELSGGQRQRVLIAIAIANKPKILIADEATTALDVTVQYQLIQLLKEMVSKNSMSMIFISHDLGLIKHIVEYVYILYVGEVVEQGDINHIFSNAKHPYTIGLLKSLPEFAIKGEAIKVIPGKVISIKEKGNGCAFYDRCYKRTDKCQSKIVLRETENMHLVRCINIGEKNE